MDGGAEGFAKARLAKAGDIDGKAYGFARAGHRRIGIATTEGAKSMEGEEWIEGAAGLGREKRG